jgi:hypothetical protein
MLGNNSLSDKWSNSQEMAVAIHTAIFFQITRIFQIFIDFQANQLLKILPKTLTLLLAFM